MQYIFPPRIWPSQEPQATQLCITFSYFMLPLIPCLYIFLYWPHKATDHFDKSMGTTKHTLIQKDHAGQQVKALLLPCVVKDRMGYKTWERLWIFHWRSSVGKLVGMKRLSKMDPAVMVPLQKGSGKCRDERGQKIVYGRECSL